MSFFFYSRTGNLTEDMFCYHRAKALEEAQNARAVAAAAKKEAELALNAAKASKQEADRASKKASEAHREMRRVKEASSKAVSKMETDAKAKVVAAGKALDLGLRCALCGPGSTREGCDFTHLECCGGKGFFRSDVEAYARCSRCPSVVSIECLEATLEDELSEELRQEPILTLAVVVGLLALGGFCCKMAFCRGAPMEIPAAMTDDGMLLTREGRRHKGGYRGDFNTEIESGEDLIEYEEPKKKRKNPPRKKAELARARMAAMSPPPSEPDSEVEEPAAPASPFPSSRRSSRAPSPRAGTSVNPADYANFWEAGSDDEDE